MVFFTHRSTVGHIQEIVVWLCSIIQEVVANRWKISVQYCTKYEPHVANHCILASTVVFGTAKV